MDDLTSSSLTDLAHAIRARKVGPVELTRAYLDRIAYTGPIEPNAEVLRNLHRAHMLSVPFENLDIGLGRTIVCEESVNRNV